MASLRLMGSPGRTARVITRPSASSVRVSTDGSVAAGCSVVVKSARCRTSPGKRLRRAATARITA